MVRLPKSTKTCASMPFVRLHPTKYISFIVAGKYRLQRRVPFLSIFCVDWYYLRLYNFDLWSQFNKDEWFFFSFLFDTVSKDSDFRTCDQIFSFVSLQTPSIRNEYFTNCWQWRVNIKTKLHLQATRKGFSIDLVYLIQWANKWKFHFSWSDAIFWLQSIECLQLRIKGIKQASPTMPNLVDDFGGVFDVMSW